MSQSADTGGSTAERAKEQSAELTGTAKDAGAQVAGTAKSEAQNVVGEVKSQSRRLLDQTTSELSSQAGGQQQRLAGGLSDYAGQLRSMASDGDQQSPLTGLVHQLADHGEHASNWLAEREPREILDDVRAFARRRPAVFLAASLGAGLLVGRLSRGLFAEAKGGDPAITSQTADRRDDRVTSALDSAVPLSPEAPASAPAFTEPVAGPVSGPASDEFAEEPAATPDRDAWPPTRPDRSAEGSQSEAQL